MAMRHNVRRLRESKDMTQEQLADVLGVKRATVAQWESGIAYPRMGTAIKLVKFFGISLDDLMAERMVDATDAPSADEMELLELYRLLDANGREMALCALRGMVAGARQDTSRVDEVVVA